MDALPSSTICPGFLGVTDAVRNSIDGLYDDCYILYNRVEKNKGMGNKIAEYSCIRRL